MEQETKLNVNTMFSWSILAYYNTRNSVLHFILCGKNKNTDTLMFFTLSCRTALVGIHKHHIGGNYFSELVYT